jgi:hypothetical protein
VALEATFRELSKQLHKLHDALDALNVTAGDQPENDEAALADGFENTVLDLIGELHEARKSALHARRAVSPPINMDLARRALTNCQERFHRIEHEFAANLVSYEKLRELARLGSERRAWLPWANTVKQGVEECRQPLEQTSKALAECWQELAERAGMTSISVRNAIVGQKIVARDVRAEDEIAERVT